MTAKLSFLLLALFLIGCDAPEQPTASLENDTTTVTTADEIPSETDAVDTETDPPEQPIEATDANTEQSAEAEQQITEHVELTDDWEPDYTDFYEGREFMIVLSSKDFEKTKEYATSAAQNLNLELKIDGIHETDGHLSFSREECEGEGGFGYPCYVARGRWDDGNYVSIEQSDAYDGFTRGYYIVVVSSGETGDATRRELLTTVKEQYPSAYIKKTKVYVGCMH